MSDYSLSRAERLRSLTSIRRMFSQGKGGFVYPFRYVYLLHKERTEVTESVAGSPIEVMFSVPKKFHKRANRRNLLKRRTREAYRFSREALRAQLIEQGAELDIAFIYSTKEIHSYKTISHAVQRILEQIGQHL